ncbi:MAG: hypothetical protein C0483_19485 [Pirellula sp.]|nr:hypothetical protein [Pirellula sp.]
MTLLVVRNRRHCAAQRALRRGYTLLEVMLVMVITMVLVTAVGSALNIYLRSVEAGRAEVEQAQLARALLRRIADDLRSAVPVVVDSSTAEPSTASAALSGAISAASGAAGGASSGGSSSGGSSGGNSSSAKITNITGSTGVTNIGGSTGATSSGTTSASSAQSAGGVSGSSGGTSGSSGGASGSSKSGGSTSSGSSGTSGGSSGSGSGGSSGSSGSSGGSAKSAADAESESSGDVTIAPLGVYGNQYDLQVDVSRLPRIDRMDSLTGTITPDGIAAAGDPPSDVKTVSYYISTTAAAAAPLSSNSGTAAPVMPAGGLVRRQVDRAIVNYGTLYGGSTDAGTREQMLAPEATALEFRYYDGTEWLTSWSSSDRGAVPVAIEIMLTLRAADAAPVGSTLLLASPGLPQEQTYRLMVHLPAGEPSTAGEASTTEDTSSTATEASP